MQILWITFAKKVYKYDLYFPCICALDLVLQWERFFLCTQSIDRKVKQTFSQRFSWIIKMLFLFRDRGYTSWHFFFLIHVYYRKRESDLRDGIFFIYYSFNLVCCFFVHFIALTKGNENKTTGKSGNNRIILN